MELQNYAYKSTVNDWTRNSLGQPLGMPFGIMSNNPLLSPRLSLCCCWRNPNLGMDGIHYTRVPFGIDIGFPCLPQIKRFLYPFFNIQRTQKAVCSSTFARWIRGLGHRSMSMVRQCKNVNWRLNNVFPRKCVKTPPQCRRMRDYKTPLREGGSWSAGEWNRRSGGGTWLCGGESEW